MTDYLHQLTPLLFTDRRLRTTDNCPHALCSMPHAFFPQTTDYGLPTTVYRIITPEGHTILEAAHIRPWAYSQDDRPANGLALCKLCHWSFDRGFMRDNEIRHHSLSFFCKLTTDLRLPTSDF